jgi:adenosylcobinamide kinase/adenosylcobinamide-phosphate guanylyltransferase
MRPGRGFSLLIGGARSGKSDLAVKLGKAWPGEVILAATAEASDDDMAARIERHQAERPIGWGLLEAPLLNANDVVAIEPDTLLLVDCITLLVSNLIFDDKTDRQIDEHASILSHAFVSRPGPTIVISNEVGLGVHPETELGRRYRDVLGRFNKRLADRAETTLFVSAGRVTPLHALEISW